MLIDRLAFYNDDLISLSVSVIVKTSKSNHSVLGNLRPAEILCRDAGGVNSSGCRSIVTTQGGDPDRNSGHC